MGEQLKSNVSKSEKRLKALLNKAIPSEEYEDNIRPDWLKNPDTGANLELDRYYPRLMIGIEFNGPQHRQANDYHQWKRDRMKKHLCAKAGVILLVFYWNEVSLEIVQRKIEYVFDMRAAWARGESWVRG